MSDLIRQQGQAMRFDKNAWVILNPLEQSIKAKIEKFGTPLKDWDISINYGIKTGCNEAFIISGEKKDELISKDKKSAEIIRPILRGRDIQRYDHNFADCWLIAAHNGYKGVPRVDINKYPAIKEWLDNGGIAYNNKIYKGYEQLAKREDQGDTPYNLRSCVYMDDFSKPKIIWKRVGSILRFCFDNRKCTTLDSSCFAIGKDIDFLLAVLNSKMGHYLLQDAPKTGTGDLLISVQAVEPLLIPCPIQEQKKAILELLTKMLEYDDKETQKTINAFIYDLYDLTNEERHFIDSRIK